MWHSNCPVAMRSPSLEVRVRELCAQVCVVPTVARPKRSTRKIPQWEESRNDHLYNPRVVRCSTVGGQQGAESPPQSLIAGHWNPVRVDSKMNRDTRSLFCQLQRHASANSAFCVYQLDQNPHEMPNARTDAVLAGPRPA